MADIVRLADVNASILDGKPEQVRGYLFYDRRKNATVNENGKVYNLINDLQVKVAGFKVDGGLISGDDVCKCDRVLILNDRNIILFIELKGKRLSHALEQLTETINIYDGELGEYKVYARCITSPRTDIPNIKVDPKYVKLSRLCKKRGGAVACTELSMDERVSSL